MEPESSPISESIEILKGLLSNDAQSPATERDIREHLELMQEYRAAIREITTKFEILDEDAHLRLQHNPIHTITSRLKSPTSIAEKLHRKGLPISNASIRAHIFDVAGVRVVCNYLDDIATVENALLVQDDIHLVSRDDYVANPKPSGYRSLHLVVTTPIFLNGRRREVPVEVQIRTIAMDFWATLEHRLRYKNPGVLDANGPKIESVRNRLVACADHIAALDQAMQDIQIDIEDILAEQEHNPASQQPR